MVIIDIIVAWLLIGLVIARMARFTLYSIPHFILAVILWPFVVAFYAYLAVRR